MNTIQSNATANSAPLCEAERLAWVASLKTGDMVEVPYGQGADDIYKMEVCANDDGWLRLLRVGDQARPGNYIWACEIKGITRYTTVRIRPVGTSGTL